MPEVPSRLSASDRLEADLVSFGFIVSGLVPPQGPPADEAERQLRLRRRNVCLLADSYAEEAFVPVIDDAVVSPGVLDLYSGHLRQRPLRLVQLVPSLEVIRQRDAGRDKNMFELWSHLHDELHASMPRIGLWLDTSEMTAVETVDAIVGRLDEALIER